MDIKVGVSNRHIHLCKSDFEMLFGNSDFYSIKDLYQEGEFQSNLTLSIKTPKNIIKNVSVLGPLRDKTQVEISRSDAYLLGINPPIRMSGDLDGALDVVLVNGDTEIVAKEACILAHRHIHVKSCDTEKLGLSDGMIVSVKVNGIRGGRLDNIIVKAKETFNLELHLDTDEANALNIKNGDLVSIIKED